MVINNSESSVSISFPALALDLAKNTNPKLTGELVLNIKPRIVYLLSGHNCCL